MKILVDENMPHAKQLFQRIGNVEIVSGRAIPRTALCEASALMVRSVTSVSAELLQETAIKFVGTATAGTDHVDKAWLRQQGIDFFSAPGCNAIAVVEYVFSALLAMAERGNFSLSGKTVGIVGVGNVGSRLNACLKALGIKTLLCDPPRADRGDKEQFWPLEKLVREADILTLHMPLHQTGAYQSFHLINDDVLAALPDDRILINTCRGAVVDNAALLKGLKKGKKLGVVLDVWENEPHISQPLLEKVAIGTPHIAGYTLEGKTRGTTQLFEAFSRFCKCPQSVECSSLLPPSKLGHFRLDSPLNEKQLKRLMQLVYDVRFDACNLRCKGSREFDDLRKRYGIRREWSSFCIQCDSMADADLLQKIGFSIEMI